MFSISPCRSCTVHSCVHVRQRAVIAHANVWRAEPGTSGLEVKRGDAQGRGPHLLVVSQSPNI